MAVAIPDLGMPVAGPSERRSHCRLRHAALRRQSGGRTDRRLACRVEPDRRRCRNRVRVGNTLLVLRATRESRQAHGLLGETCDVRGRPSFDPQVDSTDHPSRWRGLFDFSRDDNPVKDYTIVVVPYCTGDTFLNDRARTYTSGPRSREPNRTFEIKHVGALDAQYVLDWTYAHVRHPERVFVTGSSAGAIPSPLYAAQVAKRYPKANVVQLGDAAGGYRSAEVAPNLFRSGAAGRLRRDRAYRDVDSASLNFEMLYIVSAREAPRASFAQYNNVEDSVQAGFLRALGAERVDLAPLLRANLSDIRRAVPRLRSYTAPGAMHTILQRPQFYTMTVDGTRFRDWLAAQLDGNRVDDVGESLLQRGTP
jgi:hypothetical protein